MKRLLTLFLLMCVSLSAMASNTSVKNADGVDIWYNFNSSTKTASVTYKGDSGRSYSNEYSGEVVIPSTVMYEGVKYSVTSIGDEAFIICSALTSITIPEGVTSIGEDAFDYCCRLYEVYNKSNLTITAGSWNNGYVAYYAKNVYTDSEGESKLKTVGDYIFYVDGEDIELIAYTGSETSITLPSDYKGKNYNIGNYAFYECDALTSITLPEGLTSIGEDAFDECSALTSITLPEGLTSIGEYAFEECSALTSITLPESLTSIGKYAFNYCCRLYEVYNKSDLTITAGSTDNGYVAYYAKNVYSEGESKLKTVGDYIFYVDGEDIELIAYTGGETSITLPSDYEGKNYNIGNYAFYECDALTSVTIPKGVTSIGNSAFRCCYALRSITLPESVTSIEDYAFRNCYSLKSITIPEGVTSIGDYTFSSCYALTSITLPEGVTSIENSAFYLCRVLTSITLPEGVTSIGNSAFRNCTALKSITSKNATPPTIVDGYTFQDVNKSIPVYVPKSSVDAYKSAVYWKDFTNIVGAYFVDVTAENGTVKGAGAYEENAKVTLTVTPAEGYKFVQWSDGVTDNPRTVVVTSNMTFTADIQKCWTVYATAENGDISGVGVYLEGDEATLTATPAEGYKFVKWSDGVTDNPRTVVVVSDMTFTAKFELKEYTLTTEAENGTVEGAGTYKHGDKATLKATPAEGYKFVQWNDGVTDNPRTVVVVSDMTFTADVQKCWTVYATAVNGNISGVGVYFEGDKATLTATPAEGYKFVQWSDGVTDNPRTIVVVSDMTFTAEFELKEYTLTTEAENGTVKGAGTYKHGDKATLTATPAEGYKFVQWSDGVTDNSRTIVVVSDMTFTAEFELKEYTLTTEAENGTVKGAGTYKHGDKATLTATPAEGYKFVQWSDGVTDNSRTIVVVSNMTFTAEFELKEYTLTTEAENGTVEGADTYKHGDKAKLTATPAEGYKFVQWSDGVTDNSRTIVVVSDMTFTAEFELKEYTLITEAENGTVEGAGTYKHGDKATLKATPAEGYKFVQWSDGVTDNPRIVIVTSDTTFTAVFELKEYTVAVTAKNGTVEGVGTYKHGDEATLTATPIVGYIFAKWSDGVTDNPRTVIVTSDTTLTAEFEIDDTPISDIQTSDVNVRLIGNRIVVEGADDYTVYSISGQNLGKVESVERGIYIVVVNGKSFKVVAK